MSVTICAILASELFGWNMHIWDMRPSQLISSRRVALAAQILFLFASSFGKLSILATYLRIAPLDTWFRRLTYWAIALVTALMIIFLIVLTTQCM